MNIEQQNIKSAEGKLGVLSVGLGAVTTTFITGVLLYRKGLGFPGGSFTQLGKVRVGKGKDKVYKEVKELVPLASVEDLCFGAWDVFEDNAFEAALKAEVIKYKDLKQVKEELTEIVPYPAVFEKTFVPYLEGTHIKPEQTLWQQIEALKADMQHFKQTNDCTRLVVIWSASTEKYLAYNPAVHHSLASLEKAIQDNDVANISPSICYAYAALSEGVPFVMGAPNLSVDIPALWELATIKKVPFAGKDYKTGQTLLKTTLAPMLRTRLLGLQGWFSTNILGNRDGEVLNAPENFKTKEVSKLSVIQNILDAKQHPELYQNIFHKVRINYYPPRKDNKEGWDNLDIFGWMGEEYGMQLKVDFLCRDSILAAPLVLDLALLIDLAQRAGKTGMQTWLSFYFKSPLSNFLNKEEPLHDIFQQHTLLKNELRFLGGYNPDEELD